MTSSVTLFSDRVVFETDWRNTLEGLGLTVRSAPPDQLPELVDRHAPLVVDAGAVAYDEDELLAHLGLARAVGAIAAVMLPDDASMASLEELAEDLCTGLVAKSASDVPRICATLARRASAARARRFEYLTVSPRGGALLAILADGSASLLPRPAHASDDQSDVVSIVLADDALRATLRLSSGAEFEIRAEDVPVTSNGESSSNSELPDPGEMNGQKLGARIRSLRLAAGLTQAELARRTGIHRPNIARVEAGRHTPSLETLARLAAAIGVPTTRVLSD